MGRRGQLTKYPDRVEVGLDEARKGHLQMRAALLGVSVADVIREAIDRYLSKENAHAA